MIEGIKKRRFYFVIPEDKIFLITFQTRDNNS